MPPLHIEPDDEPIQDDFIDDVSSSDDSIHWTRLSRWGPPLAAPPSTLALFASGTGLLLKGRDYSYTGNYSFGGPRHRHPDVILLQLIPINPFVQFLFAPGVHDCLFCQFELDRLIATAKLHVHSIVLIPPCPANAHQVQGCAEAYTALREVAIAHRITFLDTLHPHITTPALQPSPQRDFDLACLVADPRFALELREYQ